MSTYESPLDAAARQLSEAEREETRARNAANAARARYAPLVLTRAFPGYTVAAFARNGDLLRLRSDTDELPDIDLGFDRRAAALQTLSDRKLRAICSAEICIHEIGGDMAVLELLAPGEFERFGWTEFNIALGLDTVAREQRPRVRRGAATRLQTSPRRRPGVTGE